MKKTNFSFALVLAAFGLGGCVVKTSESSEPETAGSPPPPVTPAAAPAPAPVRPAPAAAATSPTPAAAPASPAPAAAPAASTSATPAKKPEQPTFTPPPRPKTPPAKHKMDLAAGQPASMHSGAPRSFWLWHDGDTMTWHLRTTTAGQLHRFSGRVWGDNAITNLKPDVLEAGQDRVRNEQTDVVFDFLTGGAMDGFDFTVPGGKCVTFHLLVDQKPVPSEIAIGAKAIHPGNAMFTICR